MDCTPHLVLCVDDEAVGLRIRKILLERAGYQVLTATDGDSGLQMFATHPVEAVVLDYSMPGMHGGEVARRMRQAFGEWDDNQSRGDVARFEREHIGGWSVYRVCNCGHLGRDSD